LRIENDVWCGAEEIPTSAPALPSESQALGMDLDPELEQKQNRIS
ncbi:putative Neutral alpha-glucosidase AB-like protein, partial [Naja naja]